MVGRYAPEYGGTVRGPDAERHRAPSSATAGPATSASSRTGSRRRSCWPTSALLGPEDLDLSPDDLPPILPLAEAKEKFQRDYINEILTLNNGNRTKTARDLGVDPRTIFRHLEKGEGGEDGGLPADGSHEQRHLIRFDRQARAQCGTPCGVTKSDDGA